MDIEKDFIQRLRGRAEFCRDRGEVKTPELLERAAQLLEEKAQAVPEGFVLIPRKMPDELNDHLWDFMTDNFVCANEDGDSFMACDDFDIEKLYMALVKAQEPAND